MKYVLSFFQCLAGLRRSATSYLSENEAKNLQNGDVHLAQFPGFDMRYLENHLVH